MPNKFRPSLLLVIVSMLLAACAAPAEKPADKPAEKAAATPAAAPVTGHVVRHDARLDQLIPKDARIEKLAEGYTWTEGPVWNRKGNYLLFSDIPSNTVFKWEEGKGASQFLQPSGYTGKEKFEGREPGSNGLTYDAQGRLVLCEHGDRRVARLAANGKKTTLADKWEGKRLNSPNDLAYKSNGDLYFTDPPYGLPKTFTDPRRELDFCGVYRLPKDAKDGRLILLTKEIKAPNGIAFAPGEKKLYVASSDPDKAIWMVYDVFDDGSITNGKVFHDATQMVKDGAKGLPDGLKVDKSGNLFATGPGGVHILAPDGTHLGLIEMAHPTANVAFGGDGSTLYITSNQELYRLKLSTKGMGY